MKVNGSLADTQKGKAMSLMGMFSSTFFSIAQQSTKNYHLKVPLRDE